MGRDQNRIDVFISYSRAVDSRLAPAIQRGLSRLAKKWYRIRALTVFRDQTDLSAADSLGSAIEQALDDSRFFLLLASPEAARSKWVRRECEYWLRTQGSGAFLIALTDGTISWDEEAGDFDWAATDALPPGLAGQFGAEPIWEDLTWSRDVTYLTLRHGQFRSAIATLAAPVHGLSKRELDNEDVKTFRQLMGAAGMLVSGLMVLFVLAGLLYLRADVEKDRALANLGDATALSTTAQAQQQLTDDTGHDVRAYQFLLAGRSLARSSGAEGAVDDAGLDALYTHPNLLDVVAPAPGISEGLTTVSADGTRAASATSAGHVEVWSTATGNAVGPQLQDATAPGGDALGITFSSDGRRVAVVHPGSVVVWDTESGEKAAEIARDVQVLEAGIALSHDGGIVAVNGADLRLWDVGTGELIDAPLHVVGGGHVAFSPDGRHVAYDDVFSTGATVHVREVADLDGGAVTFDDSGGMSTCIDFSPDGRGIAVGTAEGSLRLWDARTGEPVGSRMTGHEGPVNDIAFSRDGTRIATTGQDRTVRLWDAAAGEPVGYPLTGPNQAANFVRFSRNGDELVSVSSDYTVRRWDAMMGSEPLDLDGPLGPAQIAVSPQGTRVAAGGAHGLQVWDYVTGERVASVPVRDGVQSVGFSSDGRSIVIVTVLGGDVMVWDGTSLRPVSFTPSIDAATTAAFMPEGLPFMPTGTEIAVGTASGDLVLEDVDENLDGTPGATIPTGCTVGHIEISDDGMRLASSCVDSSKLVIVDGTTGSAEVEEGPAAVDTTVFSPDGNTLITGTSDGLVYRRDGSTGRSASVGVHRDRITAVAYSPDGRFFASASEDGSVIIYPATSTLISARLTTGFDSVAALAFTPDGSHLVAFGGTENSARIWRVFPDIGIALCDRTPYNLNEEDWNKWVSSSLDHELPCPGKPPQPGRGS